MFFKKNLYNSFSNITSKILRFRKKLQNYSYSINFFKLLVWVIITYIILTTTLSFYSFVNNLQPHLNYF